jgi:hypothetical protein
MKYLKKYFLFLESEEQEDDQTNVNDPSSEKDKSAVTFRRGEYIDPKTKDEDKNANSGGGSGASATGAAGSGASATGAAASSGTSTNQPTTQTDEAVKKVIIGLVQRINNAFNEEHADYYFSIHSSDWTGDDEDNAIKDFCGNSATDPRSWWGRTILKELKKYDVNKIKDSKKKDAYDSLVNGKIWREIKDAIDNQENLDVSIGGFTSISISGDFGSGNKDKVISTEYMIMIKKEYENSHISWDSASRFLNNLEEVWVKKLNPQNLTVKGAYGPLNDILVLVDKIFKGSEIWKKYKRWYNPLDKNSEAAKAFKDSVVDPSIRIINTLQEKIDASKLDQDAKDHLNKECRRIKGSKSGFLYSIVNKMTGYFQGTDDVEIQISSSDGSYRTFVEIDTDF